MTGVFLLHRDKWVKWVGDEAEKRLAEFFPSLPGETVQNYLWAHTVICPSCESVVPLSPNWWLYKRPEKQNLHKWCAVKPIPNPEKKRVDFELVKGRKGKGTTIIYKPDNDNNSTGVRASRSLASSHSEQDARTSNHSHHLNHSHHSHSEQDARTSNIENEYDPDTTVTISRGVGKCPNCGSVIEDQVIKSQAQSGGLGHQLYAVAYKKGQGSLEFRIPVNSDFDAIEKVDKLLYQNRSNWESWGLIPIQEIPSNTHRGPDMYLYGIYHWQEMFNSRQLLTLAIYIEIIREAKTLIQAKYEWDIAEAIVTYLALVFDRCVDRNCRLSIWHTARASVERASTQHALNLTWNYPEINGAGELWNSCADAFVSDYQILCAFFGTKPHSTGLPGIEQYDPKTIQLDAASADSLYHIPDNSLDVIVTDPPYYDSVRYGEISDFFYVWLRANLLDIFPNLFFNELTDKDKEAIANPGRFRNMGESPEILANRDYEAKMALAFAEYYRVLRDDGVMTVQFNHKESGAWDVLAKSLIDAGFEITASWAVSTENPQNLHQAQKNSVSSTVLLVCRKRDPNAEQAWWDDLRPEVAFAEARKAIAAYRFRKLAQTDTAGFDPLTQWYLLAWDAFRAREFPFDEARQLALAIGGFNVSDLAKTYKLLDSASGTCKFLTPQQRFKKRAFSINEQEFSARYLVDGLHAIIAIYLEEESIQPVRRFMKATGLVSNDMFMRTIEVALKVIPRIGDEKKRIPEEKALLDLWLAMDEIKAKVVVEQLELPLQYGQLSLDLDLGDEKE